jgi:iron complex transport system ATP-binding protein
VETSAVTELVLADVVVSMGARPVLNGITLRVSPGELVTLLGPNGAGKTTLLRAALGLVPCERGGVALGGNDPAGLPSLERARRAAYLPQQRPLAWPLSVRDVVSLGRFAFGAVPGRLRGEDAAAVDAAIHACDLQALEARRADALSGGELSRVHVARAMAARAPLLLADEPIAALDPLHQIQVMTLLRAYVDAGNAALVVLHDAALAARFSHRLAWLCGARLLADGPPRDTLTAERMAEVYAVDAAVSRVGDEWAVALKGAL